MSELFRYDDDWNTIKEILSAIGDDADTATVSHGKIVWAPGYELVPFKSNKKCPLRKELERLTQQYLTLAEPEIKTAEKCVSEIAKSVKEIATARDWFKPYQWPVTYEIGDENAADIYQLLTMALDKLQDADKRVRARNYDGGLRYKGEYAAQPAKQDYLLQLAAIADELAGAKMSMTPKQKQMFRHRFVYAAAKPVMPRHFSIRTVREFLSYQTSNKKTKRSI